MDELKQATCCFPLKKNHEDLIYSLFLGMERAWDNLSTRMQDYYTVHLLGFLMPA